MRLCFGTFMTLLSYVKNSTTNDELCRVLFECAGYPDYVLDRPEASKYKSGSRNIPPSVIDAARSQSAPSATRLVSSKLKPLLKAALHKRLALALIDVIRNDDSLDSGTSVGIEDGYTKADITESAFFNFDELLANILLFTITSIENDGFKSHVRKVTKDYVESFAKKERTIHFETMSKPAPARLFATVSDKSFDDVFEIFYEGDIRLPDRPSSLKMYLLPIFNDELQIGELKKHVHRNLGRYVFSRAAYNGFIEDGDVESIVSYAIGRLKEDPLVKTNSPGVYLGEILLYSFLEHSLQAPKIMSRVEFPNSVGQPNVVSEGVHLVELPDGYLTSHQLVFGASDIEGDLGMAVDRAFEKISRMRANQGAEYRVIETAALNRIFDSDTNHMLLKLVKPSRSKSNTAEMAFGLFLGYTAKVDYTKCPGMPYADALRSQIESDAAAARTKIMGIVESEGLRGFSFYVYILPFNDAVREKDSIMSDVFEGRVI